MGGGFRSGRPRYVDGKEVLSSPTTQRKLSLVSDYNIPMSETRDAEKLINEEIVGSVSINYGGSVSKSTYVNGVSDVDCRVYINGTSLEHEKR